MLLEDLDTYLSANGITNVSRGYLPPTPDAAVALFETGGTPSRHTMGATGPGQAVLESPHVQVVVRNPDHLAARRTAQKVFKLLDGLKNQTLGAMRYHWITAIQTPFILEIDGNRRWLYACNYEIRKDAST